jgi:hypothetical protein
VKNRESFIERKIRMLEEQDKEENTAVGGSSNEETGRPSLDCLGIKPRLSRVAQEQLELRQQQEEIRLSMSAAKMSGEIVTEKV